MEGQDCIFCKIAAGDIPSKTIYEDEDFRVILDINPAEKGHALIIPKKHYADIYELPEDIAASAMVLAKKLATHISGVLGCDGFNIIQNNGEVAGQTVFHFHLHLIPRYKNMKNDDILIWSHETFTEEETREICDQIKKELR